MLATNTPDGPQAVAELPAHVNEATAMRSAGAEHTPLFGGSGPSQEPTRIPSGN